MLKNSDTKNLRSGTLSSDTENIANKPSVNTNQFAERSPQEEHPSQGRRSAESFPSRDDIASPSAIEGGKEESENTDSFDESRIRDRAYYLFVESGYVDGHADDHWFAAQREIALETGKPVASPTETSPIGTSPIEEPIFPSHKTQERKVA